MLAFVGLLGAAALAGTTPASNPTVAEQLHDRMEANSDDPMRYHFGQPNPRHLRQQGTRGVRLERPYMSVPHDVRRQQTEKRTGGLRWPELPVDMADAINRNKWEHINADFPFTGHNNAKTNHHVSWQRSIPKNMREGISVFTHGTDTLEDTVGTLPPPLNTFSPSGHEDQYVYQIGPGSQEFNTGRRHVNGMPVFVHPFKS